jgi:phosphotransferase system HPr (HPr) family protein
LTPKAVEDRDAGALGAGVVDFGRAASSPGEEMMAPSAAAIGLPGMTDEADEFGVVEIGPHNCRCEVTISNEHGFHMRPVTEFAALAQTFESEIHIEKGNQKVDGKDPFDLLMLEAVAGTRLVIEARGSDAMGALAALARLVRSGFPEKKPAS